MTKKAILVVEDSHDDYKMIRRGFDALDVAHDLIHIDSGDKAIDHLFSGEETKNYDAVVLDLNMPGTDGREVLKRLKGDDRYKSIPVLVFTSSLHDGDIETCYDYGANTYIPKPMDLAGFKETASAINSIWLDQE